MYVLGVSSCVGIFNFSKSPVSNAIALRQLGVKAFPVTL